MLEFFQNIIQFYSNESVFGLLLVFILVNVPTIFLILSMRDHCRMIRGRFDKNSLRSYHMASICYAVAFVVMHNISSALAFPLLLATPDVIAPFGAHAFFVVVFWASALCLLRLEAGAAIAIMFMSDFSSFIIWEQAPVDRNMLSSEVAMSVFPRMFIAIFYWLFRGSPLAQKYLGVRSINDFYDNLEKEEKVEPAKINPPR